MRSRALALSILAFVIGGCHSTPRIDNSSPAACDASLTEVSNAAKRAADSAAYRVAMTQIVGQLASRGFGAAFSSAFSGFDEDAPSVDRPAPDSTMLSSALCDALNGMSEAEVAIRGDSLAPQAGASLDRMLDSAYLIALDTARERFSAIRDSLSDFSVEKGSLVQQEGFFGLDAVVDLTVMNGTAHTVSRAYFDAEARTPGREVPWIRGSFNYEIPGGLAPGESARWRLRPSMFQGDWTTVRVPASAQFHAVVTRLDDPAGNPLWGGARFTQGDQRMLDSLKRIVTGTGSDGNK